MVKWKNAAEDYQNKWYNVRSCNAQLRNELNEVEKIQRKHNKLTLESLDNALRQWEYIDNKLSHDLCMPLESLIQLLDVYDVNDFCKLRDRLMYGHCDDYSNAMLSIRKLEKRNVDLEGVANDLEKQRRELEQKLAKERNVSMVQEARATDLERQLRHKTDDCGDWMDRAFKSERERDDLKKELSELKENLEKAARRNGELQNEVNKLYQRWTDTFNPEDEMLGRKVLEWQDINVVLTKYGIDSAETLDKMISLLKARNMCRSLGSEWRDVVDKHHVATYFDLENRLSLLEKYQSAAYDLQKSDGFKWLSETVSGRHE